MEGSAVIFQRKGRRWQMQMTILPHNSGYIPSYKRTDITDDLHMTFGFHTDYEFISKSTMRSIIKETKTVKMKKEKI